MLVLNFGGTVYMQINYNPLIVLINNDNLELHCFAFDVRVCQPLEAIPSDFKWSSKQVCPTYMYSRDLTNILLVTLLVFSVCTVGERSEQTSNSVSKTGYTIIYILNE